MYSMYVYNMYMCVYIYLCLYTCIYVYMYIFLCMYWQCLTKCINCINCKLSKGVNPKHVFAVICRPVSVIFKIVDVPRLIISD